MDMGCYFPNSSAVREAIDLAEFRPAAIQTMGDCSFNADKTTLSVRVFVVGETSHFHPGLTSAIAKVRTIQCSTFISLGCIELDQLHVEADCIILANRIRIGTKMSFHATETVVLLGLEIIGPGTFERTAPRIWNEPSASSDGCLKALKRQLQYEDDMALMREYTEEIVSKMGLIPVLC
jgi:hypothetical protein